MNKEVKRMAIVVPKRFFLEKAKSIHGDLYDYSKVVYERNDKKVEVMCRKHGIFLQSPEMHLRGAGCQKCLRKEEFKLEIILRNTFTDWRITTQEKIFSSNHGRARYFDFVLRKDDKVVIVEYDGKQHFAPVRFAYGMSQEKAQERFIKQQETDWLDVEFCKEHGIILWRVKYNEDKENSLKRLYQRLYDRQ